MSIKIKFLSYNLNDYFKVHILLTPSSRKFYLSYRLYLLEKVVSLEESLFISPSISQSEYGSNACSSLYRSISGSPSSYFISLDLFNDQSIYKKLPLEDSSFTDYFYSFNTREECRFLNGECIFTSSNLTKIKYTLGFPYPKNIYKTINDLDRAIFSFYYSANLPTFIKDSNDNVFVGYFSNNQVISTVNLIKNNNIYESVSIVKDDNNVITGIIRRRDNEITESYSLSISANEYLIIDNITNKLIKIAYSGESISSITFGENGSLFSHSRISFVNSPYYLLIKKETGQFTYLNKNGDCFNFSFDELGNFNKETISLINSDRSDSCKITNRISFIGYPSICEEQSYINNGYFSDGLDDYQIVKYNNSSIVNISSLSNSPFISVIGNNLLNIKPASGDIVTISQEVVVFPNGLPNSISFWSRLRLVNLTFKLEYYSNSTLLDEDEFVLRMNNTYSPFVETINPPSLTNKIILLFRCESLSTSNSICRIGAIRLTRENNKTTYEYYEDDGSLIKTKDIHNETSLNYQDRQLTSISSSEGYSSSFYYENKTLKETLNAYGGKLSLTYDNNGYVSSIKTSSPLDNDSLYMETSSIHINDELVQEINENNSQTNYTYSSSSDKLTNVSDPILNTSFNEDLSNKEFTSSFKGINQTTNYSSNIKKYNNNCNLETLITNNFGYRYNYNNNILSSIVCGLSPVPILGTPIVNFTYAMSEYLSSYLPSSKTINNTTYDFSYTGKGLLSSISVDNSNMFTFTYDALGNVIGIDEFETSTACSFLYDIHGNLIRESPHPMLVKDYSYDFEKLMYTRVNDSIEDRMVFNDNNIGKYIINNSLFTKISDYSYKTISFDSYFPLKDCLCSKNVSPINIDGEDKCPTFIYDEQKHHNVLLINETKIQYQINPSASKYIFFECKINNLQDGNSPLLTFFNPLTNQNQIKVFLNLSGQIVVFFNNVEYSSNIFVMLNTWFSFAVSLKAQNDDLYIELRVNTQSQELCIHQEANIHNLAFSLGSYNEVINDEIIAYYLSGCIENLVYGDTYLSQTRYNRLITAFINSYRYKESTYDIFGRLTKNELYENHNDLTTSYEYKSLGNKTTSLINKESHTYKNDNDETQTLISEYNYQYYSNSKLKSFTLNEEDTFQYGYDELGRISRFLKANDVSGDISINYQYDTYGNIISKVTTENNVSSTINYTYDSSNPILLIREGNRSYSYNGLYLISSSILVGTHFIVDTQYSYTGSKLSSITKLSGSSVSFKYGYNGLRRKKTIEERNLVTGEVSSSTEISYIYDNDKLILENHPDYQLRFQYDSLGKLYSIEKYDLDNNQVWKYYYIINIFNDVLGLVNESGELVVSYLYDPYGNSLGITDLSDNNLSIVNPFRYKSYYFDEETGLYYLTTRYYNPSVGRFISPDSVDYLDSSSISGLNLFVYCGNDPINRFDSTGHNWKSFWHSIGKWIQENIGFYSYFENVIIESGNDNILYEYKIGSKNKNQSPDKTIVFYAKHATKWFKFWEFGLGIQIKYDNSSTQFELGLSGISFGSSKDEFALSFFTNIEKTGICISFGNNTSEFYAEYYVRSKTVAAIVLIAIWIPELIPALPAFEYLYEIIGGLAC